MVGPPPVASSVARARTSSGSPERMSSISTPASSEPSAADQIERAVILDAAHVAPPHLFGQAVDDLDAGEVAFVHGAVEGLPGEGLLVHGAVGIAVEEAAELGLQFADALRRGLHQQPGEVLIVEPAAALDRVHEMALDRILRRQRDVVAALHHAGAAAFAEQALHRDGDVEIGIGLLGVQRREQAGAAGAEDEDVGFEGVHGLAMTGPRGSARSLPRLRGRVGDVALLKNALREEVPPPLVPPPGGRDTARQSRSGSNAREHRRAPRRRFGIHLRVQRAAMRIHRHQQRAEALDAEFPQALGMQVVHVDLLDRLDPGGLQRRRAADHREISAAEIAEGVERRLSHAAFADDELDAVALHQRPREALHAHRRGGADAQRLVAGRIAGARIDLAHIGRGVHDRVALEVEARGAAASNMAISVASRMPYSVFSSVTVSPTFSARTCASVMGMSRTWWVIEASCCPCTTASLPLRGRVGEGGKPRAQCY